MARPAKKKKTALKAKSPKAKMLKIKTPKAKKITTKSGTLKSAKTKTTKAIKPILKLAPKPATKVATKKAKKMTPQASSTAPSPTAAVKARGTAPGPGSSVPEFSMPATRLGAVTRTELKGKPYILYFYPKDDTSGCTAEACEFRNTMPEFQKLGVNVIGVSKDDLASHEKFSRKYNLTFPLATDETGRVCEEFGTWVKKSMYGREYMGIERSTFLIDSKGVIRAVWRKVSVSGHVEEVKKAVENLT